MESIALRWLLLATLCAAIAVGQGSMWGGWTYKWNGKRHLTYSATALEYSHGIAVCSFEGRTSEKDAKDAVIVAINTTSTELLWTHSTSRRAEYFIFVDGDVVYQTWHELGCLSAAKGGAKWALSSAIGNASDDAWWKPPQLSHDNSSIIAFTKNKMFNIPLASGTPTMMYACNTSFEESIYVNPIYVPSLNVWFIPAARTLYALSAAGTQVWAAYMPNGYDMACGLNYFGGTLYAGSEPGTVRAIRSQDGAFLWEASLGTYSGLGVQWVHAFQNSTGHSNVAAVWVYSVYRLDGATGEVLEQVEQPESTFSPLLHVATDPAGTALYLSEEEGGVYKFDLATFSFSWFNSLNVTGHGHSNKATTTLLVGSTLYTLFGGNAYPGPGGWLYAVDTATGSMKSMFGLSTQQEKMAWNRDAFNGSLILGSAGTGELSSVVPHEGVTRTHTFEPSVRTAMGVHNNVVYFATASSVVAIGFNGQLLWKSVLNPSALITSFAPVFSTNNNLFITASDVSDKIYVFSTLTGAQKRIVDSGSPVEGGAGCSRETTIREGLLADGTDILYSGTTECCYRVNQELLLWAGRGKSTGKKFLLPTSNSLFVFEADYNENLVAYWKGNMAAVWTRMGVLGSKPLALKFIEGGLYFIGQGSPSVSAFSPTDGAPWWNADLDADATILFGYRGKVYVGTKFGTVYCFEEAGRPKAYLKFRRETMSNCDLGLPAISPDGVMIFACANGVFAVTYDGRSKWSRKEYTGCSAPYVYQGLAYAICSGTLRVYDLFNGEMWLYSGSDDVQSFVGINASIYLASAHQVQWVDLRKAQKYRPSQLPAPLPPYHWGPANRKRHSHLWITGIFGGVVIVALLLFSLFRWCRKLDSEYVDLHTIQQ